MQPLRQRTFTISCQEITARWSPAVRSPSMRPAISRSVLRAQEEKRKVLTREEWQARRLQRRERQRAENVVRAAKMRAARLQAESDVTEGQHDAARLKATAYVGCSGWLIGNGAGYFIPRICRRVSGFTITPRVSILSKSTHRFIRGQP